MQNAENKVNPHPQRIEFHTLGAMDVKVIKHSPHL